MLRGKKIRKRDFISMETLGTPEAASVFWSRETQIHLYHPFNPDTMRSQKCPSDFSI